MIDPHSMWKRKQSILVKSLLARNYSFVSTFKTGEKAAVTIPDFVEPGEIVGPGVDPTISIVNNGDGTVTVTFEGTLQSADSVNGPWSDVDAASPLTLPASEAAQFGRAVSE